MIAVKSRRLFFLSLLSALLLSGCVYMRLLKVKNQLRDFDANFSVGGKRSWSVEFRRPLLTDKDVAFLVGAPPQTVHSLASETLFDYAFERVRSTSSAECVFDRLSVRLHLMNGLLKTIEVPETFLLYFSRRVMEETLRQAANADIYELKKLARAEVRLSPAADAELPSLERTRLLLGEPLEIFYTGRLKTFTYRYRIVDDPTEVPIIARLTFDRNDDLYSAKITWDSATIEAIFLRD